MKFIWGIRTIGGICQWQYIHTFLENFDWSKKTIHPFCTHEGSGFGRTESKIQSVCKGAKVAKGLVIQGGSVDHAKAAIEKWV